MTTYTVGLNAQTQHGCQDDTSFTAMVYPDPIAQINQLASVIDCAPLTIDENLIEAQEYINNNDSYTWTFTDINGNVLTTLPLLHHQHMQYLMMIQ